MHDGRNPFLEEMLTLAERGEKIGETFKIGGQNIHIRKLELSDEDFETLEIFLQRNAGLNLVFAIMLYHYPERFNYKNLKVFMDSCSKKISSIAAKILNKLNADASQNEYQLMIQELILEFTGKTVLV